MCHLPMISISGSGDSNGRHTQRVSFDDAQPIAEYGLSASGVDTKFAKSRLAWSRWLCVTLLQSMEHSHDSSHRGWLHLQCSPTSTLPSVDGLHVACTRSALPKYTDHINSACNWCGRIHSLVSGIAFQMDPWHLHMDLLQGSLPIYKRPNCAGQQDWVPGLHGRDCFPTASHRASLHSL